MGIHETEATMDLCLKDCLDSRHKTQGSGKLQPKTREYKRVSMYGFHEET